MNTLFRRIPLAPRVVVALLTLFGALTLAALYSPSVGAQGSGDATLSALAINDGTSAVDLNPGFTSAGTSYRTAVKYRDERLTVTATKNEANATIVFLDRSDAILDDGDLNTDGHQLDVPVGDSIFKIKVTAQDNTELVYEVTVERNDANLFGWTPTRDLNGLTDAGNDNPQGIWSNGTTMWVADDDDDKLYAYTLATGARDSARDITSLAAAGNDSPRGIWSNGTTMWVVDSVDHQLYAYTLATGARDSVKDITLDPANGAPWGIWSDGTIIWVTNDNDLRLYAYTLDGGTRQTDIEFLLSGDTRAPRGIWSDGSTLWVSSLTFDATHPLVAYTLDFSLNNGGRVGNLHGLPDWGKSFYTPGTLQLMGAGIWSDGDTAIWLASTGPAGKIHSFNTLPSQAGGVSLSSLTVNDGTTNVGLLPEFNLNDVVYWTSVVNDVNVVTVSATASNSEATVEYVNEDADQSSGHQVDVVEGTTPIGILVTTLDGAALIHQVYVERDSSRFGGWTPTKDIHGLVAAGIANPTGIWSDGTTMWVVDYLDLKLYAYTLATGARNEDREFDLDPANASPHGLWSDGRTIWVGSRSTVNLKLFAYTLKDDTTTTGTDAKGQREPTKDILLDASNNAASGIWSNETDTVWVAEQLEDKLYAYTLNIGSDGLAGPNHGMRKTGSDITLQGSANLWGIWSDGTTMWEGDNSAKSIRAYTLATGEREESKDIPFAPYQSHTWGIWSDGSTMWTVHDKSQRLPYVYTRIFSHTLPTSGGATTLSNLTVTLSPEVPSFTATLRPTFSSATDIYRVAVPNAAALVTISPTLSDNAATATYQDKDGGTLADVDTNKTGHQVSVPVGAFVINIKITKTGEPSITYTVVVERDSAEPFGWTPSKDLNTFYQDNPEADGQVPRGVWGDETTLYAAPHNTAKVFAFNRSDGTRNQAKDIVVFSDFPVNNSGRLEPIIFAGIWSDGTTMWVVDYNKVHDDQGMDKNNPNQVEQAHGKFFAYNLLDGERDKTKEFVLDSIHSDSVRGVWSDGTTVWVSDYKLQKLIAYHLKDNSGTNENEFGTRDEAKDITLHSDNGVPQGIWSDGDTMWVADWDDDKFYAYVLATGARAESQEFNLIPDNGYPRDVWSDGMTMWVPDAVAKKFFSYRMPPDGTTTTTPGVTVSETALTVTEEDVTGDSYTVVLDSQPTADVTVTVAGYSGTAVTPTPSTLTFTSVNWDMSQTVTVKAGDDADTENDTVTLTHSAASTDSNYDGSSITIASVTVTVNDNDIDIADGICGRTPAVRDALMALIPGVSDCAAVTTAQLAAITGPLDLFGKNITALAAGDFAGLTALTELALFDNDLTALPDDVFDGLIALRNLYLESNDLTTLPGEVFDGLTALETLSLSSNELNTLPDGVFDDLTSLKTLDLSINPGVPFAPDAVALPDNGTVPAAGGEVTLDVSGSGGPWGTNVTYRWALTTPETGVTVTFDDATSATAVVTIPELAEDTVLTFTLTVTGRGGINGIVTATDTATVKVTAMPTTPGVTVSKTELTVTEEDTTGDNYTVVLGTQPTADVVVMVAGHAGTGVTPNPATLTFTTSNWSTAKTVTVTAAADEDTANDTVSLTHSATSNDTHYSGITIAGVTVRVVDNDDTAAGICGRTEEVRDALVDLIPGVSDCAAVTAADLAAITGPLDLSSQSISVLAAGDFAGLTALMELYLDNNGLTTLPDDVFAGLTELEILYLNNNGLTTLPDDVFEPLTALTDLYLNNNDLTSLPGGVFDRLTRLGFLTLYYNALETLPDEVFETLTALNFLYLGDNPRAPFAPTADARPDAGRVAVAGGTVRLDGSGSGGPWGSNVSYSWALTTPASGVTVTFDNATSAMPEVTIPELMADTELTFTLTVTGRGGTDGIETATATARVTATQNITNNPPVFAGGTVQARTFDETIGDATVTSASDIGTPVSATDPDTGDTLTYVLLGADRDKFTFDTSSGQIKTRAGESYDYEADSSYSVTVAVIDGTVTVSSAVTINVTDQDEPPPVMNKPVVTATANSTTSLEVSWTEPSNTGRPDIDSYDLQYRMGNTGGFINGPQDETDSSAAIGNLTADTKHDVQVRATNAEGDGEWSPSGTGTTGTTTITTDPPGVSVSKAALTVREGDATGDSYTVVLDSQPTAEVVVTVVVPSGTEVTPSPTSRTFTTSDWETTQTVTVTAGSDADTVNDTVTLTHSAASADSNYEGITIAGVTVTVIDDDEDTPAAGICGRTEEVRDALVALIHGVSDCAAVTAADLAAITGTLKLSSQSISVLAAGDFAGLTGLKTLNLFNNKLTMLPGGVFAGLTSLTELNLDRNKLTMLPGGVFAGLTSLEVLYLNNNDLTALPEDVFDGLTLLDLLYLNNNDLTALPEDVFDGLTLLDLLYLNNNGLIALPDGVFEGMTSLKALRLADNEGVPFAPTAVARPDDRTVSTSGGTVRLDGSGSGGPWGTNVTYRWALTTPASEVTVTFDDATSATPEATIPALAADTELTFTLTVTGRGHIGSGTETGTDPASVTATDSVIASGDATLSDLRVNDGTGDLTLAPAFAPGTFVYTASVGSAVTTVTLTATVNHADASVSAVALDGTAITDSNFTDGITVPSLLVGGNGIILMVTAENGATQAYTVTVTRAEAVGNTAPTASDSSVTTNEDTAHPFAAGEFNFADSDAGDALASVRVVTLPVAGALGLDGTAVTAGQAVGAEDIGKLVFTPAANGNGTGYASFTFRVSDGTDESASAYTMRVNVTAVNDLATGAPTISGTAQVGEALTADTTGIADVDGLASPTYGYQWVRVDADGTSNPTDITGATGSAYTLAVEDVGKKLQVKVSFTDGASNDEELTSGAYPASGTVEAAPTAAGVTVSETALTVTEEDMTGASYTVVLDSQPTASVTVTVVVPSGTEVTPTPNPLTFTMSNWQTGQTVTVTAAADEDTANDTVSLTHSATSNDTHYSGITIAGVTVTVVDNDDTAAGICGRTEEVRDALVALISGVSDCAAVTPAQLAAITGPLDLSSQSISVLAAGDFAGLTALIELYLNNNGLTMLRGDVFAGLTALTQLQLNNNELETLPKDVFAELPVLKLLTLYDNELEKLPDGVFETLTALAYLGLYGNPGAPFAPTAVALPDAGTVPVAGGTVTLDGSGSDGGPWGTNVTYRWALTTPASGVRVTFDDSTSATPEATIPVLAADTELTFTLTVTGPGGTQGIAPGTDTATVTATDSVIASTDATLGTLRVNDGTRELTLAPAFAPAFASGTFASMRRRWATRSRRSR